MMFLTIPTLIARKIQNGNDTQLLFWCSACCFFETSRQYNGLTHVSSDVIWPDGSAGVLTKTDYNTQTLQYDGFYITHINSGRTITQPSVYRDSMLRIISKPKLQVS